MTAPRTPERTAAEGLQLLARSGSSSSPPRSGPRPAANTPARTADIPLENDSEEEEAQQLFEIWRAGHHARTRPSPTGMRPSGARYSEATGRMVPPVSEYTHTGDADDDESDDERYQESAASVSASSTGSVFQDLEPWVVGVPKPQHLTYNVPAAGGGVERRRIAFIVDFDNAKDIADANKARRLAVWRAKRKLGMAVLRPATNDRIYGAERDGCIEGLIDLYAQQNNGARITYALLTAQYNTAYPGENRTDASISSHVSKIAQLRAAREKHRRQ